MEQLRKKAKRAKTPDVFQAEACECGAASLSMILRYYGCELALEQIRYECGISRDGCSAADILLAGRHFGLEGHGYRVGLEELEKAPVPCILHWNFDHFVVLEQVTKKYAWINDPAFGHRRITPEELDRCYTGILLAFEPAENFQKQKQRSGFWALLEERLLTDRGSVAYLILSGLFLTIPGIVIPLVSRMFVDDILQDNKSYATVLVLALGVMYLFQISMTAMRSFVLNRLNLKMSVISSDRLLHRLFRLPMLFYEQRYTGDLSHRLEINEEVNSFLTGSLLGAVLSAFSAVFCLLVMFYYSVPLTLLGLLGIGCSFLLVHLFSGTIKERNGKKTQEQCRMTGALCAGITASSTVKACGAENEYAMEILGKYASFTESEQSLGYIQQIVNTVPSSVSNIFTVLVLVLGSSMVIHGNLSIGILVAFSQLLGSFAAPVNSLVSFTVSIQQMKAGYSKVEDIVSAAPDPRFTEYESSEKRINFAAVETRKEIQKDTLGDLIVDNLTFGYSPNVPPIVRNVSFRVAQGHSIAIVGNSGCGKSTVARLLSGMLLPWSGSISYGNCLLSDIPDEVLSEQLSMVTQESELFSGTVVENVTMLKSEYGENAIARALTDAQADRFVHILPQGQDTGLYEGGKNFSGGERQRLQIARALVVDPSVLILDEATSALDPVTEQTVMEKIRARGCTCIIVAHRLSTVRDCDAILVMDQGSIVEAGTHEELLARNGLYSRLVAGC